jgi:hypothetical protein
MIASAIAALLPKALDVIDDVIPDKDAAAKAKQDIEKKLIDAVVATDVATIETNTTEAKHRSVWVAGWRPAIGWSCAAGIFWMVLGAPVGSYLLAAIGQPVDTLPELPTDLLMELTFAMLGMAGLRTFEKLKGVTS